MGHSSRPWHEHQRTHLTARREFLPPRSILEQHLHRRILVMKVLNRNTISQIAWPLKTSANIDLFYPLVDDEFTTYSDPPSDTHFDFQWHLNNTGQTVDTDNDSGMGTPGKDINVLPAWDIQGGEYTGVTGSGIVIGILDDGLQRSHPDLEANTWSNTDEQAGDATAMDFRESKELTTTVTG